MITIGLPHLRWRGPKKHERFFDGVFEAYSMHLATDFTSRRTHMQPAVARKRGMTDGQTDRNTRQSDAYKMALLGEGSLINLRLLLRYILIYKYGVNFPTCRFFQMV